MDFAYHVHTDVGNHMVGAKVNGKLVDPDHILGNAEVVEILVYHGSPTTLSVSRHYVSLTSLSYTGFLAFCHAMIWLIQAEKTSYLVPAVLSRRWRGVCLLLYQLPS